jgi:hypothetical protein
LYDAGEFAAAFGIGTIGPYEKTGPEEIEVNRTFTRRRFLRLAGAGVAGTTLLGGAYVLWSKPGQLSGSITEVARRVYPVYRSSLRVYDASVAYKRK